MLITCFQLQTINLAQSMNLKEFHLGGVKTDLGLQTGFFFVSRRSDKESEADNLPPPVSLASQYRQVNKDKKDNFLDFFIFKNKKFSIRFFCRFTLGLQIS